MATPRLPTLTEDQIKALQAAIEQTDAFADCPDCGPVGDWNCNLCSGTGFVDDPYPQASAALSFLQERGLLAPRR